MKIRNVAAATAALTLAVSPVVAQAADRTSAPVKGQNELGSGILLGLLAAAAIIGGIIIAAGGGDDDPVSA
jgi:hypothetical protein